MAATIRHRGPDSSGRWTDARAGIALGHQRLAIIDLTAEGHQPMLSDDGRYVIAYNGEVYNFPELRAELAARGHDFRGHSDTEVVLAAIEAWGLDGGLERFVGMFAFALWDRLERELHLVRDRFGIKPMYYAMVGRKLLFGSELRALRAHADFAAAVDAGALALYLQRHAVPAPHSIYRDVHKLEPASILSLGGGRESPRIRSYWSLKQVAESGQEREFRGDAAEAADELERLLDAAVGCRMVADVPLGVFLSGGIDSSMVTALMQRQSTRPIRTFTIGFHEADYNEAGDAAAVARHLGTDHLELYVTAAEAQAVAGELGTMYDEPFADSSAIPTYLVSRLARQQVTVTLSGDGGDEVFAGYNRHLWVPRIAATAGRLPGPARRLLARLLTLLSPDALDRLAGPIAGATPGDKLHKLATSLAAESPAAMYQELVSSWRQPQAVVPAGGAATDLVGRPEDWPELSDFRRQMMYLDAMTYLPNDILTKLDRASMTVSLEARVPLLDHRLVEFAWALPGKMTVAGGVTKKLLRQVLYRHVPRILLERPKMGFAVPIHAWLRGPLRDWAETLFDRRRLEQDGFFRAEPILELWAEHLSGRRNWQHQLWDVLMFQAWWQAQQA